MPSQPDRRGWKWIHALSYAQGGRDGDVRGVRGRKSTWVELSGDDVCVTYHDTCVVRFKPDGTFVLDTGDVATDGRYNSSSGGYSLGQMPTPTTQRRIDEFSPASVSSSREWPLLGFRSRVLAKNPIEQLVCGDRKGYHGLLWPNSRHMHVDAEGRPVLETLFSQLVPRRWSELHRVQHWRPPIVGEKMLIVPDAPPHQVLGVRRSWGENRVVGTVGQLEDGRPYYQVIGTRKAGPKSGVAASLEEAVEQVDRGLRRRGFSSKQPTVLNLFPGVIDPDDILVWNQGPDSPSMAQEWPSLKRRYGRKRVRWLHLANPWTTSIWEHGEQQSFRGWLPDARPWPNPKNNVVFWLELEDGTALGFGLRRNEIRTYVTQVQPTPASF
jgi:hypothetical protein